MSSFVKITTLRIKRDFMRINTMQKVLGNPNATQNINIEIQIS